MVTNCHTFGLLVMLLSFVPFTSELQRVFSLVKFQLTEPKKSYVPQCTSENTPPKGTYVQGKNKMDKKKIIIKNSLLNFRFELSSAVSHKQHFVIAFSTVQSFRRPFFSSHNITRCCLVMSCSLTMISRKLGSTSHLEVKFPIVITNNWRQKSSPAAGSLTSQLAGKCRERG